MPRYFFNTYGLRSHQDEFGEELPDIEAAWREATLHCAALIRDIDGELQPGSGLQLEVTDEFANPLLVLDVGARKWGRSGTFSHRDRFKPG